MTLRIAIYIIQMLKNTVIQEAFQKIKSKYKIPDYLEICKHDEKETLCKQCQQEKCDHLFAPVTCHNDTEYICWKCGINKNETNL